ncbi:MAG: hypothetical protein ABJN34_11410 [Litoreibacter sp.]|uniref:hypothetical protein n=1 Tax=Litoreibacter sp. TaxID=1969459 RepID=UPI00329746CE
MQPPLSREPKLTESQGKELTNFLSDYDGDNLSDENAREIVSKIRDLGITPGSGLANVLSDAGIDARSLTQQAGIGPVARAPAEADVAVRPPPPPEGAGRGGESVDDAVVSLISDAVKAYEESDDAENLWSVLKPALQEAGYDTTQPLVDFYS